LKGGQYDLTFAENGREALEKARSQTFDLILMDIQMPVMDGLTATRLIRESEMQAGRTPVPLLALTGNARKADIELSLSAGCDAHILKPVSRLELLNAIQKYLRARTAPINAPEA
jgi:CheY-like chemotaxis protein